MAQRNAINAVEQPIGRAVGTMSGSTDRYDFPNNPYRSSVPTWMVSSFCAAFALASIVLYWFGSGERGTDGALQVTARFSFLLFWPAYTGGALATLCRFEHSRKQARNFGLAFASAHLVHIGLVIWLYYIHAPPPLSSLVFFGIAVFWVYMLALFSIGRLRRVVEGTVWRLLNTIGLSYIAVAFALDFLRVPFRTDIKYLAGYLPFVVLSVSGPLLRATALGLRMCSIWRYPSASNSHSAERGAG